MNRSKIEWCDHTFNPVTGCKNGCPYCYAETMSHRFSGDIRLNLVNAGEKSGDIHEISEKFTGDNGKQIVYPFGFEPTYHKYRLGTLDNLVTGCNIFVGAMSDMFGNWVPDEWLDEIFETILFRNQHNYLFLTKNPNRYRTYNFPEGVPCNENLWYGTSVTCREDYWRMEAIMNCRHTFVSCEPLLGPLDLNDQGIAGAAIEWYIIGAETGNRKDKVVPKKEWVDEIVSYARRFGAPVFMKDSLVPIMGDENMLREFPEELLVKRRAGKLKEKMEEACVECGTVMDKNQMATITARVGRKGKSRVICNICRKCYTELAYENGLEDISDELWEGTDGKEKLQKNNG